LKELLQGFKVNEKSNFDAGKDKKGAGKPSDSDIDEELARCLSDLTLEDVEKPVDVALETQLAALSVQEKTEEIKEQEKDDGEGESEEVSESNETIRSIEVTDEEELPLSAKFEELMNQIKYLSITI